MKQKRNRTILLGILFILLLVVTLGATFAYWAGSILAPTTDLTEDATIGVGTGGDISTELVLSGSGAGTLVPSGKAQVGQVEYVIYSFTVNWDETTTTLATGHLGTLSAVVGNKKIDGSTDNAGLVVTAIQIGGTVTGNTLNGDGSTNIHLSGAAVTVYVKVTLTEPETQEIYKAVAGKDITFTVTFGVTPSLN